MKIFQNNLSLTQKALLTLISNLAIQIAEFLTGFFITPIIIRGLGQELYGVWGMLQQLLGYFSLTEFRATATLRFMLGRSQHKVNETAEKQQIIGSTVLLWLISLPVTIGVGLGLAWFLPAILPDVSQKNIVSAQISLLVLMFNTVLDRLLSIPMQILRAQNLDYKGMGINTVMVFLGSFLSGFAVWFGFGLPGLAVALVVNMLLISIGRFWVARRSIKWIAIKWPTKTSFLVFLKTSGWLFFGGIASILLTSSDTLIVGILLGPSISSTYVTSGAVLRMVGEPLYQVVSAGNAGLVGLCGEKDYFRVSIVRKEMYFILFFFMTILGTGIIALNEPFLRLWLGKEFFGGKTLTLFLIISVFFTYLSRIDFVITDAMLFLKEKTWAYFFAGITALILGVLFLNLIGPAGMAIGLAVGNLMLIFSAWFMIYKQMPESTVSLGKSLFRPVFFMASIYSMAYFGQSFLPIKGWIDFIIWGSVISLSAALFSWFMVLPDSIRATLLRRALQNIPFFKSNHS